jgi:hypothetical protein
LLLIELAPTDVKLPALTACQEAAAAGVYATAMAGFVRWLAPQYTEMQQEARHKWEELRAAAAASATHRRTPGNVAGVALGWWYFLRFAEAAGVMTAAEHEQRWRRVWAALGRVARAQDEYLTAADPVVRFVELVREVIASGRAHIATRDGRPPDQAESWGWRWRDNECAPQGPRIGWVDLREHAVYLLPKESYSAAQRLGNDVGEPLVVAPLTLHKRLRERGTLKSVDRKRRTLTVRRACEGVYQDVLHFGVDGLRKEDSDEHPTAKHPEASGPSGAE